MSSDMDTDLTIVLLGNVGVGKSAAGNTILGREAFKSKASFKSVTRNICESTESVFGKQISVVDTPGILTCKGEIERWCQDILQSSRPCLFLVVISIGRFTYEQHNAVRETQSVLTEEGLKKSYILFTNGDSLGDMTEDDFINEDDESSLPDIVEKFEGRYHVFNNKDREKDQVKELLMKSGHLQTRELQSYLQAPEVQRRIILLGAPGSGKSSSGNTILGSDSFQSDRGSVSTETVTASAEVQGRHVTVVDTPGFTDAALTPEQLFMEIMESVAEASPGPHAFVIVVRIDSMSNRDMELINMLSQLFGGGAESYTMVLFTHRDELGTESIEEKIWSSQQVSSLVSKCHGRYCVFDNTGRRSRPQVQDLMKKIDKMVTANGGRHFTSGMFNIADTFIREAEIIGRGGTNESPRQSAQRRLRAYLSRKWRQIKNLFTCCFGRPRTSSDEDITLLSSDSE